MIFFTADEHYGHTNILRFCNRPFDTVEKMDEEIICRHNALVHHDDQVIHVGDFTLLDERKAKYYLSMLNGSHVFLCGSHDRWLRNAKHIWEKTIDGIHVVACHYAMRVWPKSHYGSWQVYGHSHGHLSPLGKQHDVGVDANNFEPVSFAKLVEIMATRSDNPNLIKHPS